MVLAVLIVIFIVLVIIDGKRKIKRRREADRKNAESLSYERTEKIAEE